MLMSYGETFTKCWDRRQGLKEKMPNLTLPVQLRYLPLEPRALCRFGAGEVVKLRNG